MNNPRPPLSTHSLWLLSEDAEISDLQKMIDDLATRYKIRPFRVHMSLLGSLGTKSERLMIERAEKISEAFDPFEVEIIGIGTRNLHLQSVFLTCAPNPELVRMNQMALNLFKQDPMSPYLPHWSVIYGDLDIEQKRNARAIIEDAWSFPTTVLVSEMAVIKAEGHPDEWKITRRIPLQVG